MVLLLALYLCVTRMNIVDCTIMNGRLLLEYAKISYIPLFTLYFNYIPRKYGSILFVARK